MNFTRLNRVLWFIRSRLLWMALKFPWMHAQVAIKKSEYRCFSLVLIRRRKGTVLFIFAHPVMQSLKWIKCLSRNQRLDESLGVTPGEPDRGGWLLWISRLLKSEASYGRFFVACESSGHSYATGGYFVGVLPVRFRWTQDNHELRITQVKNANNANMEAKKRPRNEAFV